MKAKLHNGMILCECGRSLFLCWRGTQASSLRCLNGDCPHAGQRFRVPEQEITLFPLTLEQPINPLETLKQLVAEAEIFPPSFSA